MFKKATPVSLRRLTFVFVGACLLLFSLFVFAFLYIKIPGLLARAEDEHFENQRNVAAGILQDALHKTMVLADDIAIWEETVKFVMGEKPDFIERGWPGTTPVRHFGFNFIVIKNALGEDIYVEFYDYLNKKPLPVPEGFSQALGGVAAGVMAKQATAAPGDSGIAALGVSGIFFFEGAPYLLATMPIMEEYGAEPVGTLTLGHILNVAYLSAVTHQKISNFSILPTDDPKSAPHISSLGAGEITMNIPLPGVDGTPLLLRLNAPRALSLQGRQILDTASLALILAVLALAGALYCIVTRLFLRPVEQLNQEITALPAHGALDAATGPQSLELANLRSAINEMLYRLNQSSLSLNVLRSVLAGPDVYLYVSDLETDEILFANDAIMRHFGFDESALGEPCWRVFHPNQQGHCAFCPNDRIGREPGTAYVWEERNEATGRTYRNTDSIIEWVDGRLAHLQNKVDITEIKNAEISLTKRLEQQELMSAIAHSFIFSGDAGDVIHNALALAGRFMGASRAVLARYDEQNGTVLFTHEWVDPEQPLHSVLQTTGSFRPGGFIYDALVDREAAYVARDSISGLQGLETFIDKETTGFIVIPVYVEGAFRGILGMDSFTEKHSWSASDVQFLKLIASAISGMMSRNAMQEELVRLSSIVDSSPQYIAYLTPEGKFQYLNQGALDFLGYSAGELLGADVSLTLDPDAYREMREIIIPKILKEGKLEFELPVKTKQVGRRLLAFSAFTAGRSSGGIGAIATDITVQRELEKEVIAAKEQAESSSRAKGEFLSRMSHEIRTPLNAIIGMTGIAKTSSELKRKEYCLEKIESASTHLLGVINDILDMSKIEANRFELAPVEFDFEKMLIRVVNVVNFRVDEKSQNLIVNLDKDVPAFLIADEQRLAQVITNLLSNAVKFTPEEGTVTLSVRLREQRGDICTLLVEVTDTGIGISGENQRKLFTSFEQADGGIARKFGGTGLGLAISKSIVEMMGGEIGVTSQEGHGATFSFTIKARQGRAKRQSLLDPAVNWANLRVMVVDDAEEVLQFFREFAEAIHLRCDLASSGEEACALLEKHRDTPYNIIFVDWKMPGMNGIELTRRIKSRSNADSVVIMISAMEWGIIEKDARASGVDKFMPKPLFTSLIVDCINQTLDSSRKVASDVQASAAADCFAGRHILLAEDIEVNREIVVALLEHTGVSIDLAENGREAYEAVKAAPGKYDIIFMDIHMPEVDGYEATRLIRAIEAPEARQVPIVAMTANVFREDIERCLASGMNDHIGKPINLEEILQKLKRYIGEPSACETTTSS